MARNEEKAMAMLNRWVKMKRELNINKNKVPKKPNAMEDADDKDNKHGT
jgi:hypothetical protein